MNDTYLAIDFGGGSGRVIAGQIRDKRLEMQEIHRFPNRQIRLGGHVYWDFLSLFEEMKTGIRKAVGKGLHIRSIGIDTWGVDFGLIDRAGSLLGNPQCYRDPCTEGMPEAFFQDVSPEEHYRESGIQVMPINTLFQLLALQRENPGRLEAADRLLFMPDLFSYFLTGNADNEYCIASTSELLDASQRTWNWALIDRLGLPRRLFGRIVLPGTSRGKVLPEVAAELGLPDDTEVIAVGSHDTAAALFAVPFPAGRTSRCAFLSSGTWSLLGVELERPILTEEARQAGADISYDTLLGAAAESTLASLIDVDDPRFTNPTDMQQTLAEYCRETDQQAPETKGDYVRCVLRSLAARYKKGIDGLNALLPEPVEQLHIIGGGSRNRLLNRLTEEATGVPVVAGPVEATAMGNILVQAIAAGEIKDKSEIQLID